MGEFFSVRINFDSVRTDFIVPTIARLKAAQVVFDLTWMQDACEEPEPEELPEEQAQALRHLSRDRLVEILEGAGIQCYDTEPPGVLAEALRVNILDGTIDASVLFEESE